MELPESCFQVFNWNDGDERRIQDSKIDFDSILHDIFGEDALVYRAVDLRTGTGPWGRSSEEVIVSSAVYTIFASGRTMDGRRKTAVVQGFPCYMGIELPDPDASADSVMEFLETLPLAPFRNSSNKIEHPEGLVSDFVDYVVIAETKVLHTVLGKKPRDIAWLVCRNMNNYRKVHTALCGVDDSDPDLVELYDPPVYRSDSGEARYINKYDSEITPMFIKMFHELEIESTQFVDFASDDIRVSEEDPDMTWMFCPDYRQIVPMPQKVNAPRVTASFDIEAEVLGGRFPTAMFENSSKQNRENKIEYIEPIQAMRKFIRRERGASRKDYADFAAHIYDLRPRQKWRNEYAPYKINHKVIENYMRLQKIPKESFEETKLKITIDAMSQVLEGKTPGFLIPIEGEEITMISVVVSEIDGSITKYLASHLPMKPGNIKHPRIDVVPRDPSIKFIRTKNEADTIIEFFRIIKRADADIVTGWNIFGFDYKYMLDRLVFLGEAEKEMVRDEEVYKPASFSAYGRALASVSGIPPEFRSSRPKYVHSEIETSAGGKVTKEYIDIPLRVTYDLFVVIKREFNLSSYSLDSVSADFLVGKVSRIENCRVYGEIPTEDTSYVKFSCNNGVINTPMFDGRKFRIVDRKTVLDPETGKVDTNKSFFQVHEDPQWSLADFRAGTKFKWHESKNDVSPRDIGNLTRKSDVGRYCVAVYCVQDSILPLRIIDRKMIGTQRIELSNVCRIPLDFAYNRAQDAKVFNVFRYFATKRGFVIPRFKDLNAKYQGKSFEGAYVFDPVEGLYLYRKPKKGDLWKIPDLVAVLDFASLYPNEEISCNMGHETFVPKELVPQLEAEGRKIQKFEFPVLRDKKTGTVAFRDYAYFEQPTVFDTKSEEGKQELSVLAQMLVDLYAFRKSIKREMYAETNPEVRAILDGKQLGAKLVLNSAYGLCGSSTGRAQFGQIAASTTMAGRNLIHKTAKIVESGYDGVYKVIYGDSVAGDTPVLIRARLSDGSYETRYVAIEDIVPETAWAEDDSGKEIEWPIGLEIWSDLGFTVIENVVRHKTRKRMFRVWTETSVIDVTEDHSLLRPDGTEVSAVDLSVGSELMAHDLPHREIAVQPRIRGGSRRFTSEGSVVFSSKVLAADFVWDLNVQGYDYTVTPVIPSEANRIRVSWRMSTTGGKISERPERIVAIEPLGRTIDYVYDIETANHHFAAGIGRLIVHNTDSVFLRVDIRKLPGAPPQSAFETQESYERAVIEYAMERADKMSHEVSGQLGGTRDLELEKGISPLLLLSKKRYIGNYVEPGSDGSLGAPYIKSMGVQTKRRDNSPVLKKLLSRIILAIVDHKSESLAVSEAKEFIDSVLDGKMHWKDFVITKNLSKEEYSDPEAVVQNVLADRIKERTGTRPALNDRISYMYVQVDDRDLGLKQGYRVETPEYALEHNLKIDYAMYVTNQLANPATQFFEKMSPEALREFQEYYAGVTARIEAARDLRHREYAGFKDIGGYFETKKSPPKRSLTKRDYSADRRKKKSPFAIKKKPTKKKPKPRPSGTKDIRGFFV